MEALFAGRTAWFAGQAAELLNLWVEHGGETGPDDEADLLFAYDPAAVRHLQHKGFTVFTPDWIIACVEAKRILSLGRYVLPLAELCAEKALAERSAELGFARSKPIAVQPLRPTEGELIVKKARVLPQKAASPARKGKSIFEEDSEEETENTDTSNNKRKGNKRATAKGGKTQTQTQTKKQQKGKGKRASTRGKKDGGGEEEEEEEPSSKRRKSNSGGVVKGRTTRRTRAAAAAAKPAGSEENSSDGEEGETKRRAAPKKKGKTATRRSARGSAKQTKGGKKGGSKKKQSHTPVRRTTTRSTRKKAAATVESSEYSDYDADEEAADSRKSPPTTPKLSAPRSASKRTKQLVEDANYLLPSSERRSRTPRRAYSPGPHKAVPETTVVVADL